MSSRPSARPFVLSALAGTLRALPLGAQSAASAGEVQALDQAYTDQILEDTTDPFLLTPYVDRLPASETVPTPLDVLGHIARARDVLSYTREVHRCTRGIDDEAAARLIAEGEPFYWATGAVHSPETGSPEMLMELVYRPDGGTAPPEEEEEAGATEPSAASR